MQAVGGKGTEGKLVGAAHPGGEPTGVHHQEGFFPSHPYSGVERHELGPGRYGDVCRLATGKRNKTSSLAGSSRRVPFLDKLRQAAGLSTVSSRRPG